MTATYKATEQYLDDEDREATGRLYRQLIQTHRFVSATDVTVAEFLKALEDLRNHLRGKYYGG